MSKKLIVGCCCVAAAWGTFALLRPSAGQTFGSGSAGPVPAGVVTATPGGGQGFAFFSPDNLNAPQEAQLSHKINETVGKYTSAKDDDAKRAARDQLSSALGELFDLRQKQREEEIKQIESRVAKLRETLKKREAKRQELVEHHLTTLIQDAEGLGWGSDPAGGNALYVRPGMQPAPGGRIFEVRTAPPVPVAPPVLPSPVPRAEPQKPKYEPQM